MYSIVRFTVAPTLVDELGNIGSSMNSIRPGVFTGMRRRGDGFACEVSSNSDWFVQVSEFQVFVREFAEPIQLANRLGATVTLDVAVEPEDKKGPGAMLVLGLSPELLAALSFAGMAVEFSYY